MSGIATPQNDLSFLLDRMRKPVGTPGRLPTTDTVAALPTSAKRDADAMARYFYTQMQRALAMRRSHATSWMKVLSILSGVHYFRIDQHGMWRPLRKHDERQIRATVPVLKHRYRREHGRLTSNQIGISAAPLTGRSPDSFYSAQLAQDTMTHWIDEIDLPGVEDEANQQLLVYGGYVYYAEKNPDRQQVYPRAFPMCDLLPIPYDARNWTEMDGVMRVTMVTDTWLEMQDELWSQRNDGKKPPMAMSKLGSSQIAAPSSDWVGFSSGIEWYSRFRGARVTWVWMKPNETNGWMGEHAFMVEDKLFGYVSGTDPTGRSIVAPHGDLPLYPVYYLKVPHDWWPYGFCEELVPMQKEMNRQMTNMLEAAQINRGFLIYDQNLIAQNAIQDSISGLVPADSPGPETRGDVIKHVPPAPIGREIGALLEIVDRFADSAAGHESGLIEGRSEGRLEGGPAINTLNANAQAPITPVLDRKWRALKRLYGEALDGIREVWPLNKKIKVLGAYNIGREILVERSRLPGSDTVMLSPTPLIVNGRMGMLQMMMNLRSIQTEDGPLIKTRELRRGLQMLDLSPPGVEIYDKREQRILYRISQLIGDGNQPLIAPAGSGSANDMQQMEDHAMVVETMKEIILDPSFGMYGPQVQKALRMEFEYHRTQLDGVRTAVDNFDDAAERADAMQAENMLSAMENDPTSTALKFSPTGYPFGV